VSQSEATQVVGIIEEGKSEMELSKREKKEY